MDLILETRGLKKHFGALAAVDGIDLKVAKGELRCIIGPNGAGKTTLFNLITGHLKASAGKVFLKGQDITGMPVHEIAGKGIGRKFQIPSIFDDLTVSENMLAAMIRRTATDTNPLKAMFGRISSEQEETARKMLGSVGLTEKANLMAKHLSHGEKQWLEIIMSVSGEPDLILLDEPTAGMTMQEADTTANLLESLAQRTTVIVIEHDIRFVKKIAKLITVLDRGRVLAEGSVSEIENMESVVDAYLGRGR